ncbi:MAG: GDP-mannose 4,6-dehydratase [Arcicella sp.]|nr:GDP-mannose 4,6-dehydratase [Arcicella sp.]
MNALIFGSNGQDGFYLSILLKSLGIQVIGVSRSNADEIGDIANLNFVESVIKNYTPHYIFNFAANSTTRHNVIFENHQTISTGTLNVLESVKQNCPNCKIFLSGSAMQFKNKGLPIDETTPFEASSPYSISRIHSVYAARYYRNRFGLKVYVGFFFNHDSPLRNEHHINQKIAATVKRIKAGSNEKLPLGNMNVKKEFSFAGDIVEAVWKFVNQEDIFEAVIGSGLAYSIKDWVEYCFQKINKNWKEHVVETEGFVAEYSILVSNPAKIKSLGWSPKTSFDALADLMMDDTV